jgi:hypothetical protein
MEVIQKINIWKKQKKEKIRRQVFKRKAGYHPLTTAWCRMFYN